MHIIINFVTQLSLSPSCILLKLDAVPILEIKTTVLPHITVDPTILPAVPMVLQAHDPQVLPDPRRVVVAELPEEIKNIS